MDNNFKKMATVILLPLVLFSCDIFKNNQSQAVRTPQSDESDSNNSSPIEQSVAEAVNTVASRYQSAATNISNLCSLPREFTNPVLYDQYCGRSCLPANNSCDEHSDCCSHRCTNGVCQVGGGHFVPIGERCRDYTECETGKCNPHPTEPYKICYGSLSRGICEFITETCIESDNCCSGSCFKNKCIGSEQYPASKGQSCYLEHRECASNQCNFLTNRCR